MKWFFLIIALIVGFFIGRELMSTSGGSAAGPRGVAIQFLDLARANNVSGAAALAEPAAQQQATQAAQQIASLGIAADWVPMWQRTSTDQADDAWTVQITGKGQMLVVEVNKGEGDQYLIHTAVVTAM